MRLNSVGVADVLDNLKSKWQYLIIGDIVPLVPFPTAFGTWGHLVTSYDGSTVTGELTRIELSDTVTDSTSFTNTYELGFLDLNNQDFNSIFFATDSTTTSVDSFSSIPTTSKTDTEKIIIKVKCEIIR